MGMVRRSGGGALSTKSLISKIYDTSVSTPKNNQIAVLGPSHAANHFNTSSGTGYPSSLNGSAMGPVNWVNFLSGGRAILESRNCFGWNGDWTSAMTVGGTSYPGADSRVDAVIASGCGTVVLDALSANDRNSWTSAQTITNMASIIKRLSDAGLVVVVLADYPHGSAAATSFILPAAQQVHWEAVNAWTMKQGGRNVYIIDTAAILRDTTQTDGRAAAGLLHDGLHRNQLAAFAIARALLPLWNRLFTPFYGFPANNHDGTTYKAVAGVDSVNPYFNGTGGTTASGASGSIPTGWRAVLGAGLSCSYTKKTTSSFIGKSYIDDHAGPLNKDWLELVISGTASATSEVVMLRQDVAVAVANKRAMVEVEVDPGYTGINVFNLMIWQGDSSDQARQFASPGVNQLTLLPSGGMRGVLRTPILTMSGTQNRLQFCVLPINGATVSATIRLRALYLGDA